MGYEYRPSSRGQKKTKVTKYNIKDALKKLNNKRTILTAIVLIVAIFVFVSLRSFTGFVAAKETEQKQLQGDLDLVTGQRNECNTQLVSTLDEAENCKNDLGNLNDDISIAKSELENVNSDLTSTKITLTDCQSDLSAMGLLTQQLNSSLTDCQNQKAVIQDELDQLQINYDDLALNSAKAICCRPGITSSQWSISNNGIVCTGDNAVTC